jgi:type II secretory pathway component PulF
MPYFAANFWMLVASGVFFSAVIGFGVVYYAGSQAVRRKLDPLVRRVPGLGAIVHDQTFSVCFGIASRVLLSGGQLMEALRAGHDSSSVPLVKDYFAGAIDKLRMGSLPEVALQSETLSRFERVSLSSFGDAKQLGKLLGALAESRASTMFTGLAKFLAIMSVFTFIHGSVVTMVMAKGPTALGEAFQATANEFDGGPK